MIILYEKKEKIAIEYTKYGIGIQIRHISRKINKIYVYIISKK